MATPLPLERGPAVDPVRARGPTAALFLLSIGPSPV